MIFYVIKNYKTIRSQVSQPATAGKGTDMSELQAHRCMAPEFGSCVMRASATNKVLLQKLNQVIGIKLLPSGLLKISGP